MAQYKFKAGETLANNKSGGVRIHIHGPGMSEEYYLYSWESDNRKLNGFKYSIEANYRLLTKLELILK